VIQKLEKLEMMRGFAALYVMAGHLFTHRTANGISLYSVPFYFGQEAVMLFFLISGFVILLSTEKQQPDFATYLSRRWKRIYPIYLLALGVTAIDIVLLKAQPFPWHNFLGVT
jgi:peptidoglycan/LPS O-acetylase OafA/YrhL